MKYSNPWLIDQIASGKQPEYIYFWGHTSKGDTVGKECLSQWYPAGFDHDGLHFASAEHWMMHHKALSVFDRTSASAVLECNDVRKVKAIGRQVANYDDKLWMIQKYPVVVAGNVYKFGASEELKSYLLGTGNAILVEASPYDKQWGIGMNADDARKVTGPAEWKGMNLLGWALMEARDLLRE